MPTEDEYILASERADHLEATGRVEDAKAVLQEALERARAAGNDAFALFFEGELAFVQGDHEKALELEVRAVDLRLDSALILRSIAAVLNGLSRYEEALEWNKRAIAVDPNDLVALGGCGAVTGNLGRIEEAIEWFDKVLAIRPDDVDALRMRGIALSRLGELDEGLEWLDKALAIEPDDYRSVRAKALVHGIKGNTGAALRGLARCLEIRPEDEQAKIWVARFEDFPQARATVDELERRRLAERGEAEREAREREIRLDAWRRLSGRSAHRIGNQLFAWQGALRTLKSVDQPDLAEAVDDLGGCLERIRRIVKEFQDFSKNESPKLLPTSIRSLVEDVVRRYAKVDEGVKVSADVADVLPVCRVDREQMDQAIGELLENAFHHTPPGGKILVTATSVGEGDGRKVRMTVEDTGPGVPAEHKTRIFDPFLSLRPGGTGLGLAIVAQVIENHHGSIRETGTPGEGARFEIELPIQSN